MWEIWGAVTPVYVDGISNLLNLTYDAVDLNEVFDQILNVGINPSGEPAPTPAAPPVPYATPRDFGQDITNWLAVSTTSEAGISKARLFNNIDIPGAALGTVIAGQSFANPDYAYNWVRDASRTISVVYDFYTAANSTVSRATYESILFEYAQAGATEQNDQDLITGLGEPKFFLNNSAFTGPWGRPQNDGPASRAITLMNFANAYLSNGGSLSTVDQRIWDSVTYPSQAPVMKDLKFVAANWTYPSFDLWEEESSDHFYTRMVQRRALIMGSVFATNFGDSALSSMFSSAAAALTATLSQFWDPARNLILYEHGPVLRGKSSYKDVAVVLGVLHGYNNDDVYGPTNDQVLASAYEIATSFLPIYLVAQTTVDPTSELPLGIPVGRYPEDTYNGITTDGLGNPWYLCTVSMAELFYRAATQYVNIDKQIVITSASLPFWQYFAPQETYDLGTKDTYGSNDHHFAQMVLSLKGWGDAFMRRVKYETPANGHLTEQYDRNTGAPTGALDLTWSYAALLTASFSRAQLMGDTTYLPRLSNL
ncbi:glycoside hydrolase 15 protein [Toensbergia leucococca]|nr:glycoside hydrolase 15 protein [Toensbergia leucococca]